MAVMFGRQRPLDTFEERLKYRCGPTAQPIVGVGVIECVNLLGQGTTIPLVVEAGIT